MVDGIDNSTIVLVTQVVGCGNGGGGGSKGDTEHLGGGHTSKGWREA